MLFRPPFLLYPTPFLIGTHIGHCRSRIDPGDKGVAAPPRLKEGGGSPHQEKEKYSTNMSKISIYLH